jgi:hypothetical protein
MLVLTWLCHPRAFLPPQRSLRPTNKPGTQTNSNTQKNTHREHTNQHAKGGGQRDRAASCDGNKPHQNQQHPIRCPRMQVSALTAKSDSRGPESALALTPTTVQQPCNTDTFAAMSALVQMTSLAVWMCPRTVA